MNIGNNVCLGSPGIKFEESPARIVWHEDGSLGQVDEGVAVRSAIPGVVITSM